VMWTNGGPTPYNQYSPMFNPRLMVPGQIDFQAMHQLKIPAIEAALDKFKGTDDEAEQRAALTDIHKLVAENLPTISLFANPNWYEWSTRRFTGWVTEENQKFRPMPWDGIRERVWHALALKPIEGAKF
jgi:peptide/nickel transport system substrate-binding protein